MHARPVDLTVLLDESGVLLADERIDAVAGDATRRLCALLGPVREVTGARVKGTGRTAHWLETGAVVVSEDAGGALVQLYLCFDENDSSPYPDQAPRVAVFRGSVQVGEHMLSGGEPENVIARLPGIQGFASMLSLERGDLHVGLDLRRRRGPHGRRAGPRRLVQLVAEWGPPRGFRKQPDGANDPLT